MPEPIHYFGFIRRRAGMSHAAFSEHWGTIHRDLVLAFAKPGPIERYVQDVSVEHPPAGFVNDFDGSPELWIRDQAALDELFSAERFQYAYHEDSPRFITMPATSFFVTDAVLVDGPTDGVKLIRLIAAQDGAERQRLADRWQGEACPLGCQDAPLRLVRSRIVAAEAAGTQAEAYFGIESSWWPDAETAARVWSGRDLSVAGSEQVYLARERIALA